MAAVGDDCYFFCTSTCSKGVACPFRHVEAAKTCRIICQHWQIGGCFRPSCKFRHSDFPLQLAQTDIPCYWESQPTGCQKANCTFKHSKPRPVQEGETRTQTAVAPSTQSENNSENGTNSAVKFVTPLVNPVVIEPDSEASNSSPAKMVDRGKTKEQKEAVAQEAVTVKKQLLKKEDDNVEGGEKPLKGTKNKKTGKEGIKKKKETIAQKKKIIAQKKKKIGADIMQNPAPVKKKVMSVKQANSKQKVLPKNVGVKKRLGTISKEMPTEEDTSSDSDSEVSDDSIENVKVLSMEEIFRQKALESMMKKRASEGKSMLPGSVTASKRSVAPPTKTVKSNINQRNLPVKSNINQRNLTQKRQSIKQKECEEEETDEETDEEEEEEEDETEVEDEDDSQESEDEEEDSSESLSSDSSESEEETEAPRRVIIDVDAKTDKKIGRRKKGQVNLPREKVLTSDVKARKREVFRESCLSEEPRKKKSRDAVDQRRLDVRNRLGRPISLQKDGTKRMMKTSPLKRKMIADDDDLEDEEQDERRLDVRNRLGRPLSLRKDSIKETVKTSPLKRKLIASDDDLENEDEEQDAVDQRRLEVRNRLGRPISLQKDDTKTVIKTSPLRRKLITSDDDFENSEESQDFGRIKIKSLEQIRAEKVKKLHSGGVHESLSLSPRRKENNLHVRGVESSRTIMIRDEDDASRLSDPGPVGVDTKKAKKRPWKRQATAPTTHGEEDQRTVSAAAPKAATDGFQLELDQYKAQQKETLDPPESPTESLRRRAYLKKVQSQGLAEETVDNVEKHSSKKSKHKHKHKHKKSKIERQIYVPPAKKSSGGNPESIVDETTVSPKQEKPVPFADWAGDAVKPAAPNRVVAKRVGALWAAGLNASSKGGGARIASRNDATRGTQPVARETQSGAKETRPAIRVTQPVVRETQSVVRKPATLSTSNKESTDDNLPTVKTFSQIMAEKRQKRLQQQTTKTNAPSENPHTSVQSKARFPAVPIVFNSGDTNKQLSSSSVKSSWKNSDILPSSPPSKISSTLREDSLESGSTRIYPDKPKKLFKKTVFKDDTSKRVPHASEMVSSMEKKNTNVNSHSWKTPTGDTATNYGAFTPSVIPSRSSEAEPPPSTLRKDDKRLSLSLDDDFSLFDDGEFESGPIPDSAEPIDDLLQDIDDLLA